MFRMHQRFLPQTGGPEPASLEEWARRNGTTEVVLLHARQLADILLSNKQDETDISLRDLMPEFVPARLQDLKEAYGTRNAGIRRVLNKFAMHPSTLRSDRYDYTEALQKLGGIIEEIVSEIEQRRRTKAVDWMAGTRPKASFGLGPPASSSFKISTSAVTHVPSFTVVSTTARTGGAEKGNI